MCCVVIQCVLLLLRDLCVCHFVLLRFCRCLSPCLCDVSFCLVLQCVLCYLVFCCVSVVFEDVNVRQSVCLYVCDACVLVCLRMYARACERPHSPLLTLLSSLSSPSSPSYYFFTVLLFSLFSLSWLSSPHSHGLTHANTHAHAHTHTRARVT